MIFANVLRIILTNIITYCREKWMDITGEHCTNLKIVPLNEMENELLKSGFIRQKYRDNKNKERISTRRNIYAMFMMMVNILIIIRSFILLFTDSVILGDFLIIFLFTLFLFLDFYVITLKINEKITLVSENVVEACDILIYQIFYLKNIFNNINQLYDE